MPDVRRRRHQAPAGRFRRPGGHAPHPPVPRSGAHGGTGRPDTARQRPGALRLFEKWEALLDGVFKGYARLLDRALGARYLVIGVALAALAAAVVLLGPRLRREFFPEVDAGACVRRNGTRCG